MKLYLLKLIFSLFIIIVITRHNASGQKVEYIKTNDLESILRSSENKLFVVNFWATWCGPCVKELPHFVKASGEYDTDKVRFILISIDFPSQIEKQLIPFLKKYNITQNVSVMMETDQNSWIEKVDPSWQGNIPATLIFNNNKNQRIFYPGELDEPGLREMINSFL